MLTKLAWILPLFVVRWLALRYGMTYTVQAMPWASGPDGVLFRR